MLSGLDQYTRPDLSAVALITIDTQCDTLDGQPVEIAGTSAALPRMAQLVAAFRALHKPVVHIVRIYQKDAGNVDMCRKAAVESGRPMFLSDAPGTQLAPEILPSAGVLLDSGTLLAGGIQRLADREVVIYKPRWGAFFQTPLETHLRALGVTTLVFAGCNFPNCPRTSIYEASERDFRLVLVNDAVSGLYDRGVAELKNIGVTVLSTAELLAQLAAL